MFLASRSLQKFLRTNKNFMKQITADDIVSVARSLIGVPFVHQGRSSNGVDCVGFAVLIAQHFGIKVVDMTAYNRTPSATKLREMIEKNLDEVPLSDARKGDFLLMRLGGVKARHLAVISEDRTDYINGIEPMIIHAINSPSIGRVEEVSLEQYKADIVAAFRFRDLR